MHCIKINIGSVVFIILITFLNVVNQSNSSDNDGLKSSTYDLSQKHSNVENSNCPSDIECFKLGDPCIKCSFNESCVYGSSVNATCHAVGNCTGEKTFARSLLCRYCYQTENWEHVCAYNAKCKSISSPRAYYRTNCTVKSEVLCLGRRTFLKNVPCNWTGGYKWSTALVLSITLGGFGADRFYLGHWQEGIGKLFSFGGLGVWTLIDVILISLHYLGPADGSLYI
ncbi:TM2 domain-containing protein almondex isoform X1 [Cryptotermes secundus]|uniref:TM2 domain-containing protein almondex isoform X1 n=1 Tax=Cryptotermes secundus TaxID=105785 RepID=UPI000CD7BDFE|nr:TM2 domain-containing protein almondex isoform X1 [Cryptotermes secundus]